MLSIKKLFEEAVKYEYTGLAHYILCILQEGIAKQEEDFSIVNHTLVDKAKVNKMVAENVLGFQMMKVFALKYDEKFFYFVYAKDAAEAKEFFRNKFHVNPKNCHEYDMDFEISSGNRFISFRELKKEFNSFPNLIGYFERRK